MTLNGNPIEIADRLDQLSTAHRVQEHHYEADTLAEGAATIRLLAADADSQTCRDLRAFAAEWDGRDIMHASDAVEDYITENNLEES